MKDGSKKNSTKFFLKAISRNTNRKISNEILQNKPINRQNLSVIKSINQQLMDKMNNIK